MYRYYSKKHRSVPDWLLKAKDRIRHNLNGRYESTKLVKNEIAKGHEEKNVPEINESKEYFGLWAI